MNSKRMRAAGVIAGLTVAGLVLAACGGGTTPTDPGTGGSVDGLEDMDPVSIVIADQVAETGPAGRAFRAMIDEVEERSGGKITFETYFSSSLVSLPEQLEANSTGLADITQLTVQYWPQELPASTFLNWLGALPSQSFPAGTLASMVTTAEMYATNQELITELESKNLYPLTAYSSFYVPLFCREEIGDLADAAGTLVRSSDEVSERAIEAMGMVPVPLPFAEMYEGMERGVIDCAAIDPNYAQIVSLPDIAKNYYPVAMPGNMSPVVAVNLDTWNALPPAAQQIMLDAAGIFWKVNAEVSIEAYGTFANDDSIVFHDASTFNAVMTEFNAELIASRAQQAVPGIADSAAFIDTTQSLLDKWGSILAEDFGLTRDVTFSSDPSDVKAAFIEGTDQTGAIVDRLFEEIRANR